MITFLDAYAENFGTFRKVYIPLNNQGIVSVEGINEDTKGSNGAGKSLGTGDLIETLLFGSNSRNFTIKELVPQGQPFEGWIRWRKQKDEFKVVHWRNHPAYKGKIGAAIFKNDVNIAKGRNTIQIRKQIIQELGLTRAEFRGSVLLAANATHVLLTGKNSERFQFLEGPFRLFMYTRIHEKIKERLKTIDSRFQDIDLIKSKKDRAVNEMERIGNAEKVKKRVIVYEKRMIELKSQRKDLSHSCDRLTSKIAILEKVDPELASIDIKSLQESMLRIKDKIDKLKDSRIEN